MLVIKITEEVAEQIHGTDYDGMGSLFNCIKDASDNCVLSTQEYDACIYPEIRTLIGFDLIEFEPKPEDPF